MKPLLAIAILLAVIAACGGEDTAGADAAPDGACGGRNGVACPADQYCDFANNRCGEDDAGGRCMPRPASCPALLVPEPTCGCDLRVYSSACDATLAGADLNESGRCELAAGAFVCGYRQCSQMNEYCRRDGSDVAGEPDGFSCRGLPGGCRECACLSGEPCGDQCSGDGADGLTLTCRGG